MDVEKKRLILVLIQPPKNPIISGSRRGGGKIRALGVSKRHPLFITLKFCFGARLRFFKKGAGERIDHLKEFSASR
jgi:hypothetical protein